METWKGKEEKKEEEEEAKLALSSSRNVYRVDINSWWIKVYFLNDINNKYNFLKIDICISEW